MKKHSQNGLGLVEALLIIIAAGIVGFGGYYVWHRNRADDSSKNSNQSVASTVDTSNWLVFVSSTNTYTFKIADGWVLNQFSNNEMTDFFSNTNNLDIKIGEKARIATVKSYDTERNAFPSLDINFSSSSEGAPVGALQPSLKTYSGLEITKRYASKSIDSTDLAAGLDRYYEYFLEDKGVVMMCSYRVAVGATDYHLNIEKVLQTIQIN